MLIIRSVLPTVLKGDLKSQRGVNTGLKLFSLGSTDNWRSENQKPSLLFSKTSAHLDCTTNSVYNSLRASFEGKKALAWIAPNH